MQHKNIQQITITQKKIIGTAQKEFLNIKMLFPNATAAVLLAYPKQIAINIISPIQQAPQF